MSNPDVYERAADLWWARGVPRLTPCLPAEVVATFEALGHPLSADVVRLYSVTGGFVDYQLDGLWSLWSLARLRSENDAEEYSRAPLVVFADYCIRAHTYGLRYETEDVSSVWIVEGGDRIAGGLEEFLELYLSDPDAVWAFRSG
jgi:hypothetical protein